MNNSNASKRLFVTLLTFVLLSSLGFANTVLTLGSLFKDGMVLQCNMPVHVWGTAMPQSIISVMFGDQQKEVVTDFDGTWMLTLDTLQASYEPEILRVASVLGENHAYTECNDVLVGEVWICSGQSNMQFSVSSVPEIETLMPQSKHIRTFNVQRTVAFTEQDTCKGTWVDENPSSAVAFSFAYFLQEAADVPIGIILNPWGSSSLEAWMPRDMTETVPYFRSMMDDFDANTAFQEQIQTILDGPKPWTNKEDIFLRRQSNILYNAMMKPLAPFACRGIVWYQGERNTQSMYGDKASPWWTRHSGMLKYGDVLKLWMQRYRKEWGRDDLEFMVVMLPGYAKDLADEAENPDTPSWAWMRESQLKALDLPHTAVVNTIDLGDIKNIHPKDKLPVGQRLALLAQSHTLGDDIVAQGPTISHVQIDGRALIVSFDNAEGLKTLDGDTPTGFWLSNKHGKWYKAEATIDGDKVVLSSSELRKPKYVRYAFSGKPSVNLVNAANLPAYPFRTDAFMPR